MNSIDVSQLTLREKFQIMLEIWDDLSGRVNKFEIPKAHKDLLDHRRKRVVSGQAKILDWDTVKHTRKEMIHLRISER